GLALGVILAAGLIALAVNLKWEGEVVVVIAVYFVSWLIVLLVLQSQSLRPVEITSDSITLTNVSPVFLDRWRADREERRRQRRQEEDEEDNYFDRRAARFHGRDSDSRDTIRERRPDPLPRFPTEPADDEP